MNHALAVFENYKIRRHYNKKTETWFFSVVDVIRVLIDQPDYQTGRKYWNKLKERLKKERSESVTKCHQLKLEASDGKKYLTDVADAETLLRLIQSVPSPKAEPIKLGEQTVIIPTDPLQKLFDEIVSLINAETIQLLIQIRKLTQARDLFLPRLMSGAIEV